MEMFRDTGQDVTIRTFQTLMTILCDHYAMTAREQDMAEMDKHFSLERESAETVQAFWARFDAQLANLEGSATALADDLLFIRALKSLNLAYTACKFVVVNGRKRIHSFVGKLAQMLETAHGYIQRIGWGR